MDTNLRSVTVFEKGMNNTYNYRIPSLITTSTGTLIAAADARVDKAGDNPNNIDKVIRRSFDNGDTWEPIQTLVDYPGRGEEGSAACDPSMIEDQETKTIWMLFNHTPAGIGLWASEEGTGFDDDGNRLLYDSDNSQYSLQEDGKVYKGGIITDMTVTDSGDVYQNENCIGNIYLKSGPLLEARTSFLQIIKSEDDGLTWSEPIDLNPQVKEPWMRFIGAGPGRGLQLTTPKYKGRLLFTVYYTNRDNRMSSAVIYSDDHGMTWQLGQSPNDGRQWKNELLSSETLTQEEAQLSESQIIEHRDGSVEIFMRNHTAERRTIRAISHDGGITWYDLTHDMALIDPRCQSSVLAHPVADGSSERILFSNPRYPNKRINGVVKLSEDSGKTWSFEKQYHHGQCAYSCMTILKDGDIGLLYEAEENIEDEVDTTILFKKFSLEWIKS